MIFLPSQQLTLETSERLLLRRMLSEWVPIGYVLCILILDYTDLTLDST
jgi:hypothetical protein